MLKKILFAVLFLAPVMVPSIVSAAVFDTGLDNAIGQGYGQGAINDPAVLVARLIQIFLGVLGVIFLILTLYAGFLWMTAAGNEGQVKQAKGIIVTAAVGLVIILSAAAISEFVISQLTFATGTG